MRGGYLDIVASSCVLLSRSGIGVHLGVIQYTCVRERENRGCGDGCAKGEAFKRCYFHLHFKRHSLFCNILFLEDLRTLVMY